MSAATSANHIALAAVGASALISVAVPWWTTRANRDAAREEFRRQRQADTYVELVHFGVQQIDRLLDDFPFDAQSGRIIAAQRDAEPVKTPAEQLLGTRLSIYGTKAVKRAWGSFNDMLLAERINLVRSVRAVKDAEAAILDSVDESAELTDALGRAEWTRNQQLDRSRWSLEQHLSDVIAATRVDLHVTE